MHTVPAVEFFFDYRCPWSYLALVRLTETATRTGAAVVWKPVNVNDVLEQTGGGTESQRNTKRARYQRKDLQDWSVYCGVNMNYPPTWSDDSVPALRGAVVAIEEGCALPYSRRVFGSLFGEGKDIAQMAVLSKIAQDIGMDGHRFETRLGEDSTLATVNQNGAELLQRGGFGTPTLFVADSMFFGNDRMPLVEFAIGQASSRQFVAPGDHQAI